MRNKKIIIIPNFCEAHLIKLQIPNLINTIAPHIIIYNEGLFPTGPESKLIITKEFKDKYCYKNTNLGFDTEEVQDIIKTAQKKYPQVKFIHNEMKYPPNIKAEDAYTLAVSNFGDLGVKINKGDYLFPYEPDIFHLETSKEEIQNYLSQLNPDQGFRSTWIDFLETQYFTEYYNTLHPKSRKLCIRFGTMDFYKKVVSQFITQAYDMLHPTDLVTYHYSWFRYGKYKKHRYDLIPRGNPNYWENFEKGLQEIKKNTQNKIILRPNYPKNHPMRYAVKINLPQPEAIKSHPNYLK
jgi:hypothetical protein